ncbi:MAG: FdhF/YdeP family oxidoreductase [Phycisphaeraceae bacterium]|nr:FdhF/YdeP family oxidoreductase [Phycisphaeraceae bacterium]
MSDSDAPSGPRRPKGSPAGGWGALKASFKSIIRQQQPGATISSLLKVNQPDGFDCPGCAWPEPDHTSTFEFCENGVKAVAWETTAKRADPAFFSRHTVSELAEQDDHWLEDQGRLTHPMRYDPETDHYQPVEWSEAFATIGRHLQQLDSPDEAVFYTSGRTSNEAAFLYQLFARLYGTNNLPDCSNMCHESSGVALGEQIGIGKGTVQIDDFEKADAIFVVGQNPGTNHPRMLTELEKAARRGCRIVTINPLRERALESFLHPQHPVKMTTNRPTSISELYLQPTVGGDLALFKGIMKWLLAAERENPGEVFDHDFIQVHTTGYDALVEDIEATEWDEIEAASGLSREEIQQAADIYAAADATIICWAMGLTQHRDSVAILQTVINLLLLKGNIGRPGAGACPVRGHSNVQGDRTVGITEQPPQGLIDGLRRTFHFDPPTDHGFDVVGAIEAMADGQAKVFVGMGGNFVSATPDYDLTVRAVESCDLTVQISTKLNRSHIVHGREALILPCLGRTEHDQQAGGPQRVTVEDSMSQVHASAGEKEPASEHLLSEPAIVAGLANATLTGDAADRVNWDRLVSDYDLIRDKIARVLPDLFDGYNERIDAPGGFYLGNSARDRQWHTESGKADFKVHPIPDLALPEGQLRLMTVRSHDQYNTTIYGYDDRYRGVSGERRVLFMHPEEIARRGLRDGDRVDITSHSREDGKERHAPGFRLKAFDIPRGCAASYFPETNVLVSVKSRAHRSRTPMSKSIPITIERAKKA